MMWIFALNVCFWKWARYAVNAGDFGKMINELWSEKKVALLKELWALNLPAAKIEEIMAERGMPTPKNAIYKKAQRLGLTPRASPIIVIGAEKTRKRMIQAARSMPAPDRPSPPSDRVSPDYNAVLLPRVSKYERGEGCCWPIGDPKNPDFRFCGKKRVTRNYCSFHDRIAYHRVAESA